MKKKDLEIWNLIKLEEEKQENYINLIASENYTSKEIMQAQGSCLTNKYAEGYINNRFYHGCNIVDKIENIAISRAKKLFNADYANVQPHSGSQANAAIFQALLKPNDIILGLNLSHGGHLTHGSSINFSGKFYRSYFYKLNKYGKIDYDKLEFLSKKYLPKMIIGGFSAYSRICNWKKMRKIADNIGAYLLVDISHIAGLIIAGLYPSPIKYAHVVSTTTHKTLGGPRGGLILSSSYSKNMYKKLDSSVFPGTQGGPFMHIIAAKAIAFKEAMHLDFLKIQKNTIKYAQIMANVFIKRNFKIISNKTENHLFLIDLSKMNYTGQQVGDILYQANIIVNKNSIPNDKKSPLFTSGIRIGTPSISKRGLQEYDVKNIANWICDILLNIEDYEIIKKIKNYVKKICIKYPIIKNHNHIS